MAGRVVAWRQCRSKHRVVVLQHEIQSIGPKVALEQSGVSCDQYAVIAFPGRCEIEHDRLRWNFVPDAMKHGILEYWS